MLLTPPLPMILRPWLLSAVKKIRDINSVVLLRPEFVLRYLTLQMGFGLQILAAFLLLHAVTVSSPCKFSPVYYSCNGHDQL